MSALINELHIVMAQTYALYLKTQNYHWHVTGPQFYSLHELFESQYKALAEAIDEIAERIVILGHHAPASFKELDRLKTINDGNAALPAKEMLTELAHDHTVMLKSLCHLSKLAQAHEDEGTVSLVADRIQAHEKMQWMLRSSI